MAERCRRFGQKSHAKALYLGHVILHLDLVRPGCKGAFAVMLYEHPTVAKIKKPSMTGHRRA